MCAQTAANTNVYVFGSGKFEIGDDVGSLEDVGSLRGAVFTESWDEVEIETDNAGKPIKRIKNQKASLKAGILELDIEKLYAFRGGLDVYDTDAAAKVEDYDQIIATGDWAFNQFIECDKQNADLSVLQIDAQGYVDVTGSTDGALANVTDYDMVKDPGSGKWGIIVKDSATVTTEAQQLTISYDYTPPAARYLTSGGKYLIDDKVVRLTHTDSAGKVLRLTLYKAAIAGGLELTFPSDDSDDVMEVPFEMGGVLDVSRDAGDQLYEIYDTRTYS